MFVQLPVLHKSFRDLDVKTAQIMHANKKKSFKQAEFIPPNLVMGHCSVTVLLENKSILTKINSWNMPFAETFRL